MSHAKDLPFDFCRSNVLLFSQREGIAILRVKVRRQDQFANIMEQSRGVSGIDYTREILFGRAQAIEVPAGGS